MAESQEIGALRRRGRRRLVGAIALVLLAVIVLPMVFDAEPRQGTPAVSVRIPSEDDAGFSPKPAPAPKPAAAPPVASIPKPEPQKPVPEVKAEEKPQPQPVAKPEPAPAPSERARAETALAGGEQFYFQVGAFSDPAKVKEVTGKLKSAGLPYFTEQVAVAKGQATRVRVGPYADRAAAEKAAEQVKTLGLKPGNVSGKS